MLVRCSTMLVAILSLLLLLTADAVVDLSLDLEQDVALGTTEGSKFIDEWAAKNPTVRTAVVLDNGKIVANYVRQDVDPTIPEPVHSVTKNWMSLLIGMALQEGKLLSIEETLAGIFTDEQVWPDVSFADFKRNITIEELLTMSSGLRTISSGGSREPGMLGGGSLSDALTGLNVSDKTFSYLAVSNILSYVILERTGMTPRQYLADTVLPTLGIADSGIGWNKNADGIEHGFHGMLLTPIQMAKFGQLYLQMGMSGPENQLIGSDWVNVSSSYLVDGDDRLGYGYLFWVVPGSLLNTADMYCALGLGGQDICISPELNRVSVQQRDFGFDDYDEGPLILAEVAMSYDLEFASTPSIHTSSARGVALLLPLVLGLLLPTG